jgi:hypothetical protein
MADWLARNHREAAHPERTDARLWRRMLRKTRAHG